jgi:hypothetical protein
MRPIAVIALLLVAPPAAAQWGNAQSLFTEDGVEIGIDGRLSALFAVLNALGYDDDSLRGPLPLRRPQHAQARVRARSSFGRSGGGAKAVDEVLRKNPLELAAYVRAALELGPAPNFEAAKDASPLAKALAEPLREWLNEEGGSQVVRLVAEEAKPAQKKLLPALDKAVKATTGIVRLGDAQDQLLDDSGPSGRVVLVLNELDAHGTLHVAQRGDVSFVVAGPMSGEKDEQAIAHAVTLAYARTLVRREAERVAKPGTLLDVKGKLKAPLDEKELAVELLACAFMRQVRGPAPCIGSPLDGDAAAEEALVVLQPRVDAFAKTSAVLSAAIEQLLEAAAPAPTPEPPPEEKKDDKKGGKKGKGK